MTGLGVALVAGGIGLGTAVAVLPAATALSAPVVDLPQATTIPSFGGEGIGPGRFTDARSIGVDGDGQIYVGEYQGGRVQVFDAEGGFLTQWHADRDRPLRGLAVGRDGTVFLAQGGTIQRFQGETGEVLQPVDHPAGDGFDDVAMTADGGVVAFWYAAGQDNLVSFGRTGEVELTIPDAASGPAGESELDLRVASDGEGNLYGLGTFTQSVFVYSPQGRFLNRVGSSGDETGQLRAPYSIAVDDRGRIYVGDIDGVEVFHRDGRHLGTVDVEGFPFGLTFDAQGRLLVVNGTRVAWYPPWSEGPAGPAGELALAAWGGAFTRGEPPASATWALSPGCAQAAEAASRALTKADRPDRAVAFPFGRGSISGAIPLQEQHGMAAPARVSRREKWAYGSGDLGFSLTNTILSVYFAIFLTEVVGVMPAVAALAIFIGSTWDYVNDPLVGYLSDRTRTRWGRRRPYLLFGALPFALAFSLLWWRPPVESVPALALYYALAFALFDTAASFVYMPYLRPDAGIDQRLR